MLVSDRIGVCPYHLFSNGR